MPMDGFSLSFLERELNAKLVGGRIDKVNQPERDALVLMVRNAGGNHRLLLSANANQARAQLTVQSYENPADPPMFCMLMRKHLMGSRIIAIQQIKGDRILAISFDCLDELSDHITKTLYLEIMGRHSNLTLTSPDGLIIDSIRHVNSEMSRVRTVLPGGYYQFPPQPDKLTPGALVADQLYERLEGLSTPLFKALMEHVAGMASLCAKEVCAQIGVEANAHCNELNIRIVSASLAAFYQKAPDCASPVVLYDEAGAAIDFFPFPYQTFSLDRQKSAPTLGEAMDAFYLGRDLRIRMQQKSAGLQRHIKSALERTEKKKLIMLDTLAQSDRAEDDRIFGDLLTANMHAIDKGENQITVQNYYDENGGEVIIPLSPIKTPAQNAQSYYKKYRKAKVAAQYAQEQLIKIGSDLMLLENALEDLEKCETNADMGEIRYVLVENGFIRPDPTQRKKKKLQEGHPYRFFSPNGTLIEVGKNSLQNDRLTLHARGEEIWLHAQGIAGSHVIIRTEGEPDDETLLCAAKLAAFYSKGRNHPALAVDYTRRKHVKKAAGSPAGLVTYTNFQTVLIGLTPEDCARILKEANH